METLATKLEPIDGHVERAIAAVTADGGASPVRVAVVRELEKMLAHDALCPVELETAAR